MNWPEHGAIEQTDALGLMRMGCKPRSSPASSCTGDGVSAAAAASGGLVEERRPGRCRAAPLLTASAEEDVQLAERSRRPLVGAGASCCCRFPELVLSERSSCRQSVDRKGRAKRVNTTFAS